MKISCRWTKGDIFTTDALAPYSVVWLLSDLINTHTFYSMSGMCLITNNNVQEFASSSSKMFTDLVAQTCFAELEVRCYKSKPCCCWYVKSQVFHIEHKHLGWELRAYWTWCQHVGCIPGINVCAFDEIKQEMIPLLKVLLVTSCLITQTQRDATNNIQLCAICKRCTEKNGQVKD